MVTCKLYGRAANQAFQISAAICHAWKMGVDFAIPRKTTSPKVWSTYFKHLPALQSNRTTEHYFFQNGHGYNPIPGYNDVTLDGYWQSAKFWNGQNEELAQVMGFNFKQADYVSVHIRRGDYLRFSDQFPVLPMEYYVQAISTMKEKGYNYFKIYSDDIKWCMNAFDKNIYGDFQITYSTGKDAVSDMKDMFNAKAMILANSTFSLYPALLRTDNPVVISPADHRWFGPKGQDMISNDRVPERFIKI